MISTHTGVVHTTWIRQSVHGVASLRKLDTDNGVKCVHRVGCIGDARSQIGLPFQAPSMAHHVIVKVGTLTESSDTDSQTREARG